jgi:hypothetical protein
MRLQCFKNKMKEKSERKIKIQIQNSAKENHPKKWG